MKKILLIDKSGRIDCIADALSRSAHTPALYAISELRNPGLIAKTNARVECGRTDDLSFVESVATQIQPDFVIIGPEEPLEAGVVDLLETKLGIPCIGPRKLLARVESSKAFTRELLAKYAIAGNLEYRIFRSLDGMEFYMRSLKDFVVKPDGLTGGKGVKVLGEHLESVEDALSYAESVLLQGHSAIVIEERLDGEEFSLQSFCDGKHIAHTFPVQDHKRAYEDDTGPNTGGMGSYSCEDHCLPFLEPSHVKLAEEINEAVMKAIGTETGQDYKGVLYGAFMLTKKGLKVIEYNARFGDPEVINVLPLLENDFVEVCEKIIDGSLDTIDIKFKKLATVCKYVVPEGYPTETSRNKLISISELPISTDAYKLYFAAVDLQDDGIHLSASRAVAVLGVGRDLAEAESIAESVANSITGPVRHRKDIGTEVLIRKRIDHMDFIMAKGSYQTGHSTLSRVEHNKAFG